MGLVARFYEIDRHPYDPGVVSRALEPLLCDDTHGQLWLVCTGPSAAPLGYAVITWGWSLESGGREALLDEIYVDQRGDGAGRVLLAHAMAAASGAGATRMFLETEAHNSRVRGFYSLMGFTTEDSVWMCADLADGVTGTGR